MRSYDSEATFSRLVTYSGSGAVLCIIKTVIFTLNASAYVMHKFQQQLKTVHNNIAPCKTRNDNSFQHRRFNLAKFVTQHTRMLQGLQRQSGKIMD